MLKARWVLKPFGFRGQGSKKFWLHRVQRRLGQQRRVSALASSHGPRRPHAAGQAFPASEHSCLRRSRRPWGVRRALPREAGQNLQVFTGPAQLQPPVPACQGEVDTKAEETRFQCFSQGIQSTLLSCSRGGSGLTGRPGWAQPRSPSLRRWPRLHARARGRPYRGPSVSSLF